jgi:hypothetical protein
MAESEKEDGVSNEKEFREIQSMRGQSYIYPENWGGFQGQRGVGAVADKDER